MNEVKLIFIFFLYFAQIHSQQTGWYWQNPLPQGNDFTDISFVNSTTLFAVTSAGTLEKSTNGGVSWDHFITVNHIGATGCIFQTESTGYIIGSNLKFLKTTNGGNSYINIGLPGNSGQILTSIQMLNPSTMFISVGGYTGMLPWGIFKSTDAGQNWSFIDVGAISVENVNFLNSLTGFYFGGNNSNTYIRKTTNGGNNWTTQLTIPLGGSGVERILLKFLDENTGYALKGNLYKTTNSGINWSQVLVPSQFNNATISFSFLNSNTGFILNTPWVYPSYSSIAKTTDGGNSWDVSQLYSNFELKIISFSDINTGYILGKSGVLFKTTNSGLNWLNLHSGFVQHISNIQFINNNTGFLSAGNIFGKTINGGINWTTVQISTSSFYSGSCTFLNNLTGYVVGTNGKIFKTENGGNNWDSAVAPGTSTNLTSVTFTDAITGYVTSVSGTVFKTTNSGLSWMLLYTVSNNPVLNNIYFLNSNTGFITCTSGGSPIIRTTNSGLNWSYFYTNISGVSGIFFHNLNTGYVSGSDGALFKTTNCGLNWDVTNTGFNSGLTDIIFTNNNTGYIACGRVLKTTDSGNSWSELPILSPNNIYNVFFINNDTGFIAGNSGAIFKTTTGGEILGFHQILSGKAEHFSLSQNYPNPFNPSTKIRFNLPLDSRLRGNDIVVIKVYDALGREVTTLVNLQLQPGTYEVSWDATNYPSGVYFYKIETGNYVESKKMILVK